MAFGGSGLLRRLWRPCSLLRNTAGGGLTVDWTTMLALVVAAGLAVYLTAALLKPEKFS